MHFTQCKIKTQDSMHGVYSMYGSQQRTRAFVAGSARLEAGTHSREGQGDVRRERGLHQRLRMGGSAADPPIGTPSPLFALHSPAMNIQDGLHRSSNTNGEARNPGSTVIKHHKTSQWDRH
jgi:hypothetical protein